MANTGSIWDYVNTASLNSSTPPNGFGENQLPSLLDDTVRQMMANMGESAHSFAVGGTADSLTLSFVNVPQALTDGMEIKARASTANVSTSPNFTLNTFSSHPIAKLGGQALVAGDIAGSLHEITLRYNLANTRWELLNPSHANSTPTSPIVTGPSTSTDGDVALFSGTSGGVIKDSGFALGALLRSYLAGLQLSTAGSSGTMSVAPGTAMSDDQTTVMVLSSTMSKNTASWSSGSGNGGLDTGSFATNTWYHFYEIQNTASVVDVLFSLSVNAPTLPSGYTKQRRIGSGRSDASSHWVSFSQNGDEFIWSAPFHDASVALTTSRVTLSLTVPTGLKVNATFHAELASSSAIAAVMSSPDESVTGTSSGAQDLFSTGGGDAAAGSFDKRTNTSGQIFATGSAAGAGATLDILTYGYRDTRGRFN